MLDIQFLGKLFQSGFLGLVNHNFHHLLADELSLGALSVAGSADLLSCSLGEANGEHSEEVSISGLGLHEGLNGGVPFLDNGAQLISGDVHTVEVSVAIETFHFLDLHLHFSPGLVIAFSVQIGK